MMKQGTMANPPLVSVIICTYDQGEFIAEAIESVLAQTYKNVELLVIDNGSQDGTAEIVEGYSGRHDVRLLSHTKNGPVTERFNAAISLAGGSYVSFLYGDDYYLPEKLERQVVCLESLGGTYAVVYGPGYRLNVRTNERWLARGFSRSGLIGRDLFVHFFDAPPNPIASLYRRECFDTHKFDEEIFVEGLEAFQVRLALSYAFYYLDVPLVVMREHPRNAGKAYRINTEATIAYLDKMAHDAAFPRDLLPRIPKLKAQLLRNLGWITMRLKSDGSEARAYFGSAVALDPLQALHPRTVIGSALSLAPSPVLSAINRIGTIVRRHKAGLEYREDQ